MRQLKIKKNDLPTKYTIDTKKEIKSVLSGFLFFLFSCF